MPGPMSAFIDDQIGEGRFQNASEYVRHLIRHDMDRKSQLHWLRQVIEDGEASGMSDRTIDQVFDDARRRAKAVAETTNG